jgi:hypothetical protein
VEVVSGFAMAERRGVTADEAGVASMLRISAYRVEHGGAKIDDGN